jgi:hypothetical protein
MPADEIRPRLLAEKERKTVLERKRSDLAAIAHAPRPDPVAVRRDLEARVQNVTALLAGDVAEARNVLGALLADKIDLEPVGRGKERGYKFRGSLTIGRLLDGLVENTSENGGPNGISPLR